MKRSIIFIYAFLMTVPLWGQMTLSDCLRYAAEHAHDNIINRMETAKAGADKGIAISDLMPYISLSSSGNISFGRNIDPETNTYDNKQTLSTGFGLNMSIPLFDGLVRINNLKIAEMARRRQMSVSDIERDRISFEVIKAFYNVSYCKSMVSQMQAQLGRDSLDLEATRRAERMGVKSGADVAQLAAVVAADEFELANQCGLLAKAYLSLRGVMGMQLESAPLDLDFNGTPFDELTGNENPRITEARISLRQSRYELKAAWGAFSPKISFTGGVSTSYYRMFGKNSGIATNFRTQWHDNMGEYMGFSISIPIFTGFELVNKLKRAKINVAENLVKLEKIEYEVARERVEAELAVKTATVELEAASRRLEAEEMAYNTIRRRYELGGASAIDLFTSNAQLAAARAALEGKRIGKIISEITLSYYLGAKFIND
ncbi:MAG: TolC family protein [Muribaculaceae bacterium]|nr:TolC family protein [Muribaculaceae bacterium]